MIYFIADLHLSPGTPGVVSVLERFLRHTTRCGDQVFILGDLFEVWVGDDDLQSPFPARIAGLLHQAAENGVSIKLQHGNRDFLLGHQFAAASGASLLPDPYVLSTSTWQFVLSHGDALCSGDTAYQAFRTQVRNPAWQTDFLARPLAERLALARQMREQSMAQQAQAPCLSDLDRGDTDDFLRQHGYATFIHGHTHQPACHDHVVDGIHVQRWVLADWHEDKGEALCWDEQLLSRISLH